MVFYKTNKFVVYCLKIKGLMHEAFQSDVNVSTVELFLNKEIR